MMSLRFRRRRAVKIFPWICMLSSPVFTYPVVLNITENGQHIILGLTTDENRFENCVCGYYLKPCTMPFMNMGQYGETQSEALTAENAGNYRRDLFFQCQYTQNSRNRDVSCQKYSESTCLSNSCTINIIIVCSKYKHVVLTWDSTQQPSVLGVTGVPVIDCCKTSTTTTEVATTSTTSPPTAFTTTNPTTDPPTTTFPESSNIISFGFSQSTSQTPDAITINNTYWETTIELMETTDSQSITSNKQNGTNESSQLSSQYIGIIIGTAVAAILVTIAIMCVGWRLKTRREKNRRNDTAEGAMSISGNPEGSQIDILRHPVYKADNRASKSIALVSPLVQSGAREGHLTQPAGDYTYIDFNSATSRKSNTTLTSLSPSAQENQKYLTTSSAATEIQDGEYAHLGTNNVRQETPYNCVDEQQRSTAFHPVIIPAIPLDQHQLNQTLQTLDPYLRPTDHHISQPTGARENIVLYSKLGEPNVEQENTYNNLHNLSGDPGTGPSFSQNSSRSNMTAETGPETTASQNHKLQLFPHTSKHKSMDIVDAVPYTYTEVTPKTTHLKETNDQTILTASNINHLKPQEVKFFEPTKEMTKETEKRSKEMSKTIDDESQVYANAVYSMHEKLDEGNTKFSLDDVDYANV